MSGLINFSIKVCKIPDRIKGALVVPLYKKKDLLCKENHHPVSLLTTISKVYEWTMHEQLTEHFDKIFNPFFGCFQKRLWLPLYLAASVGRLANGSGQG